MKEKIRSLVISIYFKLLRLHGSWVLKCQMKHAQAIFCHAYIYTFTLFPEKKLSYNIDLSLKARQVICNLPSPADIQDLDENDVDQLISSLKEEQNVRSLLANYYRLVAYYYSYGISSDTFKEKIDNALSDAGLYKDEILPITTEETGILNKNIKKIHKNLRKQIRQLNSERLENEKLQVIEPIEIGQSHAVFTISLFTTLFIISGFIYIKLVYGSLGIRVSDFFTAADYLSSSVDVLTPTILSTVIGLAAMLFGLSSSIDKELHEDQFEVNKDKGDYAFPLFILISTVGLVAHSFKTGEIASIFLAPLLMLIGLFAFFRLPIWKYIKNRAAVGAILLSFLYFSLHLGFTIKEDIAEIKSDGFKSPYVVIFNSPYESYSTHEYIGGNSSYAFLYSQKNRAVIAIPRSGIKAMESR